MRQKMVEFLTSVCYNTHTTQGSYIGYYSGFPSLGGGFDSRTLLQKMTTVKVVFSFGNRQEGIEPIYMQVSSGHLLPPVLTLVATSIFFPV